MYENILSEDRMLSGAAYAVGIPALYIILSEKRKQRFTGFHGAQALFLWVAMIVIWVSLRIILDLIWNIVYIPFLGSLFKLLGFVIWLYALYCGYRAYMGEYFSIPIISDLVSGAEKF